MGKAKAKPKSAIHSTAEISKKPRGNPQNLKPWKPGQSGNPGGRKKGDTNSVTAYLKEFAGMTPQQVAEHCDTYAKKLRQHTDQMPIAGLVAVRALLALMDEPDARLFDKVVERIDGAAKAPGQIGGNTFNAVVINQKTDDGTLSGIFGILARTGALEPVPALPEADSIHTASADDEAISIPVASAP